MSDLLSAASLLLTVLGLVYGTWYAEISNAISATVDAHFDNRGPVRQTVRAALYAKALPLALAATVLTLLFLPDALAIAISAFKTFCVQGWHAFHMYDAVLAAFCLVVLLTTALGSYLSFLVGQLWRKLARINTPDYQGRSGRF